MNFRIAAFILLLVGAGAFAYSFTLPFYTDQKAYDKLETEAMEKMEGKNYRFYKEKFYKERDKIKTHKLFYMDIGSGLAIAALTILVFLLLLKIKNRVSLKYVPSVSNLKIYLLANFSWLLMFPGTYWYYLLRGGRGDYPSFADTIAIPLSEETILISLVFIPLNIFIFFATLRNYPPSKLFIKPVSYSSKEIFKEIFWAFWFLLNFATLVVFIIDGDHISIIVNIIFTYILLNLLSRQIEPADTLSEI
jgi:hypothetical protein